MLLLCHNTLSLTGLFIGFENSSYTFDEPEANQTTILDVALVTSIESERRFITELALAPGSATLDVGAGGDYIFTEMLVIFNPGVRREIVRFELNPDLIAEGTENFMIRATRNEDGPPYDCVSPQCISATTIIILDDDRKCSAFQWQKYILMPAFHIY